MGKQKEKPELCSQAKLRGVTIPEKLGTREFACLNAKKFLAGMGDETRKVRLDLFVYMIEDILHKKLDVGCRRIFWTVGRTFMLAHTPMMRIYIG
jgi:hypothetical protein